MDQNTYIIIMAGGIGSRFWPISRVSCPKQFLDIFGTGKTLLQQTFLRFEKVVPRKNIYIITAEDYIEITKSQLPQLPEENIIGEPIRKSTAASIAYMAYKLFKEKEEAKLVVVPSDHLILDEAGFMECCRKALNLLQTQDVLVTIGVVPTFPNTGYGYIQRGADEMGAGVYKVKAFTEKPDRSTAQTFISTGEYYWNAGIFIGSAWHLVSAFRQHMPSLSSLFDAAFDCINTSEEKEKIKEVYADCASISFDVGVMEKIESSYVVAGDFGWSDLGTWRSVWENMDKDVWMNVSVQKNLMAIDTEGCIVHCEGKKLVLLQGLQNYIVVETKDVLMICEKKNEQEIKAYVEKVGKETAESAMDII